MTRDELLARLVSLTPEPTLEDVEYEQGVRSDMYTKEQMLAYAIGVLDVALSLRKT